MIELIYDEKRRGVLESTEGSGQWGSSVNKIKSLNYGTDDNPDFREVNVWLPYITPKGGQAIGLKQSLLNRIKSERSDLLRST